MDQWRVQAEWRSASMECGEQCVVPTGVALVVGGITMLPLSCANSWGTVSTQLKVRVPSLGKKVDVAEVTNFT